jgi:hypothetical protein
VPYDGLAGSRRKEEFDKVTGTLWAAGVVVVLDVFVGARYCAKVIRKQAHPRIATWLIFELGVVMSLVAYFASRDHSLLKAALNLTDFVVVSAIVAAIYFEQRAGKILFTRNERLCLLIAGVTMVAWMITKTPWIGFVGFQVVMTMAYLPTIESMWRWRPGRSPEPAETWGLNAMAAGVGVVLDVTGKHDYVAMLYPLRACLLCLLIVALAVRWDRKSRALVRV